MTTWIAVACVGLGSYALRLLPMLVGDRIRWPVPVDRAIGHAGLAALTALVISGVQHHDGAGRPGATLWAFTAVIAGAVVARRRAARASSRCRGRGRSAGLLDAVGGGRRSGRLLAADHAGRELPLSPRRRGSGWSCHRLAGDSCAFRSA